MIALENKKIGNIYLGNKKIAKAYLGTNIIFDNSVKVYGVKREIASSDPVWTRIEASENLQANAVKSESEIDTTINDFDSIYPWSDIKSCDLSADGKVLAYIGEPRIQFS